MSNNSSFEHSQAAPDDSASPPDDASSEASESAANVGRVHSTQEDGVFPKGPRDATPDAMSLADALLVVARRWRLFVLTLVSMTVFGIVLALALPEEYTSRTTVMREASTEGGLRLGGGLAALQGLGVNLGGLTSEGLSPEAYPSVLSSREVQLSVLRDTFQAPPLQDPTTLTDYLVPESAMGIFHRLRTSAKRSMVGSESNDVDSLRTRHPSVREEQALLTFRDMVSTSIDQESGFMHIHVTSESPWLGTEIAESLLSHLTDRVRQLRTKRARENVAFIRERFAEAQVELREAENRLSDFVDRNRNLGTAGLRTERDRLRRQVSFKSDLFSELQAQLTQAEIELQRSSPVVTIVEEPSPPIQHSFPPRSIIVIGFFLLGIVLSVLLCFGYRFIDQQSRDDPEWRKMEEAFQRMMPKRVREMLSADAT